MSQFNIEIPQLVEIMSTQTKEPYRQLPDSSELRSVLQEHFVYIMKKTLLSDISMSKQKLVTENVQRALQNKKMVAEMHDEFKKYIDKQAAPREYQNACLKAKQEFVFKLCMNNTNWLVQDFGDSADGVWLVNAPIMLNVSRHTWFYNNPSEEDVIACMKLILKVLQDGNQNQSQMSDQIIVWQYDVIMHVQVNNPLAVARSQLISTLAQNVRGEERYRQMLFIIKAWARAKGIDTKMSPTHWALLIAYYLIDLDEPVLPNLFQMYDVVKEKTEKGEMYVDVEVTTCRDQNNNEINTSFLNKEKDINKFFNKLNKQTLQELLLQFLEQIAFDFNNKELQIDLRKMTITKKTIVDDVLVVIDPFDRTNICKNVKEEDYINIIYEMKHAQFSIKSGNKDKVRKLQSTWDINEEIY